MGKLAWRNLLRNKRRTFLTMGSVSLALLLLSMLLSMLAAMERAEGSQENRVVVRNAISLTFSLPESYLQRLQTLPHVQAITPLTWFQGVYKNDRPENFFARFASDPETVLGVFPEYQIADPQREAWQADRGGFLAGQALADKYRWKIGDQIFIKGDIYPVNLNLTLRGIFSDPGAPSQEQKILFHRKYLEEALGNPGEVGAFWLLLDSALNLPTVVAAAEKMFENSQAQVRAETEAAFRLSFVEMLGNIKLMFGAIGLAIVISILFITANTMAMAARERTTEVAVLKTLGFGRGQVVWMVLAEAVVVGLMGGLIGMAIAASIMPGIAKAMRDVFPLFGTLRLTPGALWSGVGLSLLIGATAGWFPAFQAARLRIVDGLRRVA
jgi:putative ABC transport system permease protein